MLAEAVAIADQVAAFTATPPSIPNAILPPTPAEIDDLLEAYDEAKRMHAAAKDFLDEHKAIAIFYADHWGTVPAQAKQSLRLEGKLHTLTVTRSETITVNETKTLDLALELASANRSDIFPKLFSASTKHKLLEGAAEFLRTVKLPERVERKVLSLFGQCFTVETSSPSVKVELREAEKRASSKTRCAGNGGRR